jgi:hypothetical protein
MFYENIVFGMSVLLICLSNYTEAAILSGIQQSATKHETPNTDPNQQLKNFPPAKMLIRLRSESQISEPIQIRQLPPIRKYPNDSDKAIRVTINDLRNRFARLENMIGILERVSYAMSRPAAIVDAIRLFALAISSVIVSSLDYS